MYLLSRDNYRFDGNLYVHARTTEIDRDYIEYLISDAQIIAAWYLEHGAKEGER